jgi:LPXTG-site transpeptidase (sortase) family protein
VPVQWEPPLFVVGQLRTSANVTLGNSVLVGHVRGAAGYNVFNNLDQLKVGDEIVANSRGATYNFVVTDAQELPEDDTSPTDATNTPRLTLMTCAGQWNPVAQDYSDRLWVVAQPPDVAQALADGAKPTDDGETATPTAGSGTAKPTANSATTKPTADSATAKPTADSATAKPTADSATARPTADSATAKPTEDTPD